MHRESIPPKACAISSALLAALLSVGSVAVVADSAWEGKHYNPRPLDDDVVLPMPCGGAMVFRKVEVAADGPLGDAQFNVGGNDEGHGVIEGARTVHIAGSFPADKTVRYYLMGKYEVSRLQYEATMSDECPTASLALRAPKTEVGWVDAVTFADRYSQWLLKNTPERLPREDSELGFVRLPTEVEWEYAARGGMKVSVAELNERVFPMPDGMARHVWFAGSQSANGKVQLTGQLQPNPLGLHDVLGNVDEITLEPFRLNKLKRLHGQAGGYVVRGGNYLTSESEIRTAYRQEVPFYDKGQARRSRTTGFRVMVTGPVLTSPGRLKAVEEAWGRLGAVSAPAVPDSRRSDVLSGEPAEDPIEELLVIARAAADPVMKGRLERLQLALRGNIAARDEQRDRASKAALRLGAFLGRKLTDDSQAVQSLADILAVRESQGLPDDTRTKGYKDRLAREQGVLDENLRYYADTVIRSAEDYDDDILDRQKEVLVAELRGGGLAELEPFVARHRQHVGQYRRDRKVTLAQWLVDWMEISRSRGGGAP